MSLRLWLPLNGTLENKGLDTVTITNNNATIDSSGKIGQCYSFNNSDSMIKIEGDLVSSMKSKTSFTISFWLYSNDSGNRSIYFATNTGTANVFGFALEKTTGELLRFYWQGSPDLNLSTFTIPNQEWVHITCVYKNDNVYLYKNGVLTASKTDGSIKISALTNTWSYASLGRDYRTGSTTLNGKLNDFRWYDNALSETEIKEIAKGLVLHLPLNNNGLGNENIFGYGSDCSSLAGLSNYGGYNLVTEDGFKCAHKSGSLATTAYLGTKIPLTPSYYRNKSFTLSCDVKIKDIVKGTTNFFIGPYMGGQTVDGVWKGFITHKIYVDGVPQTSLTDQYTTHIHDEKWHRFSYSGTYYDVNYTVNISPNFYARDYTGDIYIKNLKLEEGLIPTPWSPNPADEDYPASGSGIPENLFIATDMSEPIIANSSTDWTKHFRTYNGSASIHTIDTTEMTDTIALTTANSNLGIAFVRLNSEINLDPTQYYTISCEAKCTNADLKLCIGLSYYNDQSTWVWRGGSNAKSFTTADTWQKITHTFKPDANTYAICYCFTINPGASPTGTDTFSIRKCKLEKGSTATEWQPSPVDDSYKTLGYYNNIAFDQSGYNYNAIKYGNLTYSSDAPKYNVSTKFSDGSYIKYKGPESMYQATYAFWVKSASYTAYNMIHGPLGSPSAGTSPWLSVNTESSGAWAYFGNNSPNYTKASGTISTDTWHHLVYVWDNGVARWYIDGAPRGNAVTYTTRTFIQNTAESSIGDSYTGTNWNGTPFTGQLSDFRIYATALSAEDIKSLYNNNAYIDSDGKIYGEIR